MSDVAPVRLLIVDGDRPLRRGLSSGLRNLTGWAVTAVSDPIVARRFYSSVDVVLSGWIMLNGGGDRVLAEATCPVLIYAAEQVEHIYRLRRPSSLQLIHEALLHTLASKTAFASTSEAAK